ncbi:hypothetical protein DFH27DRAFT_609072 [Peziza echinospora]|nr:hypothetical protein DFH27DRAFT_609072 [Peziza echinospora]
MCITTEVSYSCPRCSQIVSTTFLRTKCTLVTRPPVIRNMRFHADDAALHPGHQLRCFPKFKRIYAGNALPLADDTHPAEDDDSKEDDRPAPDVAPAPPAGRGGAAGGTGRGGRARTASTPAPAPAATAAPAATTTTTTTTSRRRTPTPAAAAAGAAAQSRAAVHPSPPPAPRGGAARRARDRGPPPAPVLPRFMSAVSSRPRLNNSRNALMCSDCGIMLRVTPVRGAPVVG